MIDLTRALYLGVAHPHDSLAPWAALTSGRPAALGEGARVLALQAELARLLGVERATIAPSTLHVVTDLYAALAARVRSIHVDHCSYAVTRWGLERARLRGVAVRGFRSPRELASRIGPSAAIVCDAVCVACRRITPLRRLQQLASAADGLVIVDDSQGVGLLGARPSRACPYGRGGGGTLAWSGTPRDRVVVIGSLAKAFGVPIAFLAGSDAIVDWFERESGTRVHSSPCPAASIAALEAALRINVEHGDGLRARLLDRVRTFRAVVAASGGQLTAGEFPVQTTQPMSGSDARLLEHRLRGRGLRALRLRSSRDRSHLGFVVTAAHHHRAIARAGEIVGNQLAEQHLQAA